MKRLFRPLYRPFLRRFRKRVAGKSTPLAIGSYSSFELAYRKGSRDEAVLRYTLEKNNVLEEMPDYRPGEGHIIVDIGAHIGPYALLAAGQIGSGTVHAIEASQETYNLLRINVALNQCANVQPHHLAISDKNGTGLLYHDRENWGHSTVKQRANSTEMVATMTLSTFLQTQNIAHCHFMKLNVEGAEFPILLSTPAPVLQKIERILVYYHCDLWKKHTEVDLVTHLELAGFQCLVRPKNDQRGTIVAVREEPAQIRPEVMNHLADSIEKNYRLGELLTKSPNS